MWAILLLFVSCSQIKQTFNKEQVPLLENHTRKQHEKFATKAIIATQGAASSKAGINMLNKGGNLFDAAAAISFVLSVERPHSTGLGGGGFLLYFSPEMNAPLAIDFREVAPLKANQRTYLTKSGEVIPRKSLDGFYAGGVPGLVAGIVDFHKKYGKLPLSQVIAPAIELAEKGFVIYPALGKAIQYRADVLEKYRNSKKIFLPNGTPLKEGDLLVQKDLANTLRLIAKNGRDGFYKGPVAKSIARLGFISMNDLASYKVRYRRPVKGSFKGYEVYSMPPPSSGGVHLLQILNLVENEPLEEWGVLGEKTIHTLSLAMQRAFADRAKYMGDADFVKVPVKGLISKSYAKKMKKDFGERANDSKNVHEGDPWPYESDETTHFSLMDNEGNIIVSTQTINGYLGSGVVIPDTGVLLNNEMDDFGLKVGAQNLFGAVGGENNLVEPGKRPLSSMSPTIVLKNNIPILGLGSPAGTKILTCVTQTILNYLEHNLPLYDSVSTLRYHHQWLPDEIRFDAPGPSADVLKGLESRGHKVKIQNLGCKVQAVAKENERLHGVSDPRGEGLVLGLP